MKAKVKTDNDYKKTFFFFRPLFKFVAWLKLGFKAKKVVTYDEPILIMCNHTTDLDFLVVSSLIKNHFYFVSSQHVLGLKVVGKFFEKHFNPIPVFKGTSKTKEVKEILKRIKKGNNVLIFPEGTCSFNGLSSEITEATAKLAKISGAKLVTIRIKGGFFIHPRWHKGLNKSKITSAEIVGEYSRDYLKTADVNEVLSRIQKDLYVNAYEYQKEVMQPVKFKRGLTGFTRYYNVCPHCNKTGTLKLEKNTVYCDCGFKANFDKYGFIKSDQTNLQTLYEWETHQEKIYGKMYNRGGIIFADSEVEFSVLEKAHKKSETVLTDIRVYPDKMIIGKKTFHFNEIDGVSILGGGSNFLFTVNGVHYSVYKEMKCMSKYASIYNIYKRKTETKEN